MPTGAPVPLANNPTVLPSASGRTFGPRLDGFNPVQEGALGAQQVEAAGSATMDLAMKMQQQADDVRVTGALNQLSATRQTLTSDPEQGFMRLQGQAALQPQDNGMSMPDAYTAKLQDSANAIAASLTPRQQQLFQQRAAGVITSFKGDADQYWGRQHQAYTAQTTKAAIENATNTASLNYSNPQSVDLAHNQVLDAVNLQASIAGWSPEQTQAATTAALSGVTMGALHAAIADGNLPAASAIFNAYKAHLTGPALAEGASVINAAVDKRAALAAADATVSHFQAQLAPSSLDTLHASAGQPPSVDDATWQKVLQAESGDKDTNPDGTPVTSPKGARGAAQVMPATASAPGFGVAPSNGTPADDRRVGRAYLNAMLQRYGSLDEALAAYNAGPGAVDAALAQAKKDGDPAGWLSHLPAETQSYVGKITSGAGVTPPQPPKLTDMLAFVDKQLGPGATPAQRQLAESEVTRRYSIALEQQRQQAQDLEHQAQTWLLQNNGNLAEMPAPLRSQIVTQAPGAWPRLVQFAKSATPGSEPAKTDLQTYVDLATHPENLTEMSDAQFMQLRTKLSPTDFEHFATQRANLLKGVGSSSPDALNDPVFTTEFNQRMREIGLDPTSKKLSQADQQRVGDTLRFVRDQVFAQQKAAGKKFDEAQLRDSIDHLFATRVNLQTSHLGGLFHTGSPDAPLLGMTAGDIPDADRDQLEAKFKARGVANPTAEQLLRAYWALKAPR